MLHPSFNSYADSPIWDRNCICSAKAPRMIKCIGGKVLSELPYSYRLEDKTLFLHLHLPLLDQAFHLYNLKDFPISGPLGKPVYLWSTDASTSAVSNDTRTYIRALGRGGASGVPYHQAFLPLCAAICKAGLCHFVSHRSLGGFGARSGGKVHCRASASSSSQGGGRTLPGWSSTSSRTQHTPRRARTALLASESGLPDTTEFFMATLNASY